MIARKALYGAAGAAVLAAATLVAAAPPAEAACKSHPHVGRATGLLRATAGIAARQDRRREVRDHDGGDWTLWRNARRRTTSCRKPEGGRWHCVARAYACNG